MVGRVLREVAQTSGDHDQQNQVAVGSRDLHNSTSALDNSSWQKTTHNCTQTFDDHLRRSEGEVEVEAEAEKDEDEDKRTEERWHPMVKCTLVGEDSSPVEGKERK